MGSVASTQRSYPVSSLASRKQSIILALYSYSLDGKRLPFVIHVVAHDVLRQRYKRDELGLRLAYFNCGVTAGQFLGALFASGVFATMDGRFGVAAWR